MTSATFVKKAAEVLLYALGVLAGGCRVRVLPRQLLSSVLGQHDVIVSHDGIHRTVRWPLRLFFLAGFALAPSVVFTELAGIAPSQEGLLVAPPSDHDPTIVGRFSRLAQLETFEPIERVQGLHVLRKAGNNFIRAI